MGVPKFYRYLSERYPLINQRIYSPPSKETLERFFDESKPKVNARLRYEEADTIGLATLPPEIDRVYVEINGILHGCSHNNEAAKEDDNIPGSDSVTVDDSSANTSSSSDTNTNTNHNNISHEEIFTNVCFYLDRLIGDIIQPKQLVYFAIDGVAPRAKLNQQRSRRYRSSNGAEIERTIYEAHEQAAKERKAAAARHDNDDDEDYDDLFVVDSVYNADGITSSNANQSSFAGNSNKESSSPKRSDDLTEIEPGRFVGKFDSQISILEESKETKETTRTSSTTATDDDHDDYNKTQQQQQPFHPNAITPGTQFFEECAEYIEHYIQYKLSTDPKWQNLTVIFSGSNVPGEGEHKIMDFIRKEQNRDDYNPNLRHCIVGQDGDLIILGLATHEPNLVLFREKVIFDVRQRLEQEERQRQLLLSLETEEERNHYRQVDDYIFNSNFEFLHLNALRDYLSYEFETSNVIPTSPYELEQTIDDFVFMTFFVGNDFIPHIPALDIADEAFDLLFHCYRYQRREWLKEERQQLKEAGGKKKKKEEEETKIKTITEGNNNINNEILLRPYLTHAGNITSGKRLESFLSLVGSHEDGYYDNKIRNQSEENERIRRSELRYGESILPSEDILASKEKADRLKYLEMMKSAITSVDQKHLQRKAKKIKQQQLLSSSMWSQQQQEEEDDDENMDDDNDGYTPVVSGSIIQFQPEKENNLDEEFVSKFGHLLQLSLDEKESNDNNSNSNISIDDQDWKGRYYYDKFEFTPFEIDKHRALRKAYVEGLIWNLKYYYQGCVSWDWYYPYHYGPMCSDIVNVDEMLEEINFDGELGEPLQPYQQLMACMPPSQADLLPKPYRWLMTDQTSPIFDFFPKSFVIDMNGKRWPWEAVVLLPFIDSKRLKECTRNNDYDDLLTAEEYSRNQVGENKILYHDSNYSEDLPAIRCDNVDSRGGKKGKEYEGFGPIQNSTARIVPFDSTSWSKWKPKEKEEDFVPVFRPQLSPGIIYPLPGFASLGDTAPIKSLWRRNTNINVHNLFSKYTTACLEQGDLLPQPLPSLEVLGQTFIGTTIYINYPYLIDAFVTGISDATCTIRGNVADGDNNSFALVRQQWNPQEAEEWVQQLHHTVKYYQRGFRLPGTGGLIFPENQTITLSVRPFRGLKKTSDGSIIKTFAKTEMEVPLAVIHWAPARVDPRVGPHIPLGLEKNPYKFNHLQQRVPSASSEFEVNIQAPKAEPEETTAAHNGDVLHTTKINALPLFDNSLAATNGQWWKNFPPVQSTTNNNNTDNNGVQSKVHDKTADKSEQSDLSNLARVASTPGVRGISTLARQEKQLLQKKRNKDVYHSTTRKIGTLTHASVDGVRACTPTLNSLILPRNSRMMKQGNVRGRLLAVGLVAAATFIFGGGSELQHNTAAAADTADYGKKTFPALSQRKFLLGNLLRGGEQSGSSSFLSNAIDSQSDIGRHRETPPLEFFHGTTTLSFVFQGGIVAAVDSRASLGNFVGSKTVQKVLPINSHMLGTMAGGAADCSFWIRKIRAAAQVHEVTEGCRMSVARASRILSNVLYENRGFGLSIGTMVMGVDEVGNQPPKIYFIDNSGMRIAGDLFAVGSGATFALGILDTERRYNMTVDEAVALGIKAIRHATFRDSGSGGFINVYLITKEGWKKVFTEDLCCRREKRISSKNDS